MRIRSIFLASLVSVAAGYGGQAYAQVNSNLVAAVLPASRSVVVGATATAFATIINAGATAVSGCSIALPSGIAATLAYQTTNPATNVVTGSPNTPVSIAASGSQTFVFGITAGAAFGQTDIQIVFNCTTGGSVAPISGVNTFLLTSSTTATPDIVALAATVSNDGIVRTPGTVGSGAFAIATVNVGSAGSVTASVDTGSATLPLQFSICETNSSAACLQTPGASVATSYTANQTKTFSVFVTANGEALALDPARSRAFVRFRTAANSVGATSVAAQTQITLSLSGGTLQIGPVGVTAGDSAAFTGVDFTASSIAGPPAALPAGLTAVAGGAFNISGSSPIAGVPDNGLNAPVNLTVPFTLPGGTSPGLVQVLRFNSATSEYEPATVHEVNTANNTLTFEARNFSSFIVTLLNAAVGIPNTFDTGFRPAANGLANVNFGNIYLAPGGNCLGMSAFASWFYKNIGGGLNGRYSASGAPMSIADLTSTRAHVAQSVQWNAYQTATSFVTQRNNQANAALLIRYWIATQNRPMVVIVGTAAAPCCPHAILATRYDADRIYFYDPNSPTTEQSVPYSAAGFGTYTNTGNASGAWTRFFAVGSPSFIGSDSFNRIRLDADGGFTSSQQITITAPAANSTVTSRQTPLTGRFAGSLNSLSTAYIQLNGTGIQSFPVSSGSFSRTIDVASGPNNILMIAGVQAYSGQISTSLANSAVRILRFNGPPNALFRSTLRWNQNNTDIDLYVTEPGGSTAWFGGARTAGGLNLDFDNTSGFGPENITLEGASAVAQPGNYTVRVHNFRGAASSGSVQIVLNERLPNQAGPLIRNWSLGVGNSSNSEPGRSGPDWVTIGTADIVNGTIRLQ